MLEVIIIFKEKVKINKWTPDLKNSFDTLKYLT